MWFTPDSTASRKTAMAPSTSWGGPKTPGPASCIAPYPMRFTVIDVPESVKRLARSVCSIIQRLLPSYASKTLDEGFFMFGVRLWRLTPQLHLSQERRPFKRGRRSRWGQFVRRLFRFCLATEQTDYRPHASQIEPASASELIP